jgi:hypothetical protein
VDILPGSPMDGTSVIPKPAPATDHVGLVTRVRSLPLWVSVVAWLAGLMAASALSQVSALSFVGALYLWTSIGGAVWYGAKHIEKPSAENRKPGGQWYWLTQFESPSETRKRRFRDVQEAREVEVRRRETRGGAVLLLNGDVPELVVGHRYWLSFGQSGMALFEDQNKRLVVPWSEVMAIELFGRGQVSNNAGIIGGGFGLEGAAVGILAASVINAATTKRHLESFISIATVPWEATFSFLEATPVDVLPWLAPWRARQRAVAVLHEPPLTSSTAARLGALEVLHSQGSLSDDEFAAAKAQLPGCERE